MITNSLRKIIAPLIEQIDQREEHGSPVCADTLELAAIRLQQQAEYIREGLAE